MEAPLPELLALVIADHVYHDDVSGKIFVLGIRSVIGAPALPWNHPQLAAYAAFGNGRGDILVQIRLVDSDEEREPVFEDETIVTFPDPLAEVDLAI
jgi:hypothetical protein